MIQTFCKYSFSIVLTILVALNADVPMQGSMESFDPVERDAPCRGGIHLELEAFNVKAIHLRGVNDHQFNSQKFELFKKGIAYGFEGKTSLFLLHGVLRL